MPGLNQFEVELILSEAEGGTANLKKIRIDTSSALLRGNSFYPMDIFESRQIYQCIRSAIAPLIMVFIFSSAYESGAFNSSEKIKPSRFDSGKAFSFVGVAGFEPATLWSQTRCANRAALHPEEFSGFSLF